MKDDVIFIFYSEKDRLYVADTPALEFCSAVGHFDTKSADFSADFTKATFGNNDRDHTSSVELSMNSKSLSTARLVPNHTEFYARS